jgi:hypothetical protein
MGCKALLLTALYKERMDGEQATHVDLRSGSPFWQSRDGQIQISQAERSIKPAQVRKLLADTGATQIGSERWFEEMREFNSSIQVNPLFVYSDRGLLLGARLYPQALAQIAHDADSSL